MMKSSLPIVFAFVLTFAFLLLLTEPGIRVSVMTHEWKSSLGRSSVR
jgi:hypothetical protein